MFTQKKGAIGFMEIILIAVVVIALAFVGWRMMGSASEEPSDDEATTKTFVSASTGITLTYPSGWTVDDQTRDICSSNRNDECSEFVDIKSSDGVMVRFVEHAQKLLEGEICGTQSPCAEVLVHDVIPVSSNKYPDLRIAINEDVSEIPALTSCPGIELFSPLTKLSKYKAGDKVTVIESTGIPFEDFYASLFVAYEVDEDGMMLDKFTEMSFDECLKLDSVQQAIDILASFKI